MFIIVFRCIKFWCGTTLFKHLHVVSEAESVCFGRNHSISLFLKLKNPRLRYLPTHVIRESIHCLETTWLDGYHHCLKPAPELFKFCELLGRHSLTSDSFFQSDRGSRAQGSLHPKNESESLHWSVLKPLALRLHSCRCLLIVKYIEYSVHMHILGCWKWIMHTLKLNSF